MAKNASSPTSGMQKSLAMYQAGNVDDAIKLCRASLSSNPKHPETNHLLSQLLIVRGYCIEGLQYLQNAIKLSPYNKAFKPTYYDVLSRLFNQAKFAEVEVAAEWLAQKYPQDGFALNLLGGSQIEQKKYHVAFINLKNAEQLQPENAYFLSNLGNVLTMLGRNRDAANVLKKAVTIDPKLVAALNNYGNALRALGHLDEAINYYQQALRLQTNASIHGNLGISLMGKRLFPEAIAQFEEAVKLNPSWIEGYVNLADALRQSDRISDALKYCCIALELDVDNPKVWVGYGEALRDANQLDEAIEAFIKALSYRSENDADFRGKVFSNLLFSLNYHPDLSAELIYSAYQDYDVQIVLPHRDKWHSFSNDVAPLKRLKVGYVAHVYCNHVCRHYFEPLLEKHDRERFEIYAYANPQLVDQYTVRYQELVDHWVSIKGMSDDEIARQIREDGIDILVDVSGHTSGNSLSVFARKPAPVSLHWLDFGYTTGSSAIDYYLTDNESIPVGSEYLFTEKPWFLDGPSFVYRPGSGMGDVRRSPAKQKGFVTFGALTRAIRINHKTLRVWSSILNSTPRSRLVLNSGSFKSVEMQEEIINRFAKFGIERDRLDIGYDSPPWDVLRDIDIGLDCFPHNSGATLLETLYMGSPVVTLAGRPSVGRLGASVLTALGHPEWIANNEDEYINIAITLANDINLLEQTRLVLRAELQSSSLMDESKFVLSVENAYRQMWQIYCDSVVKN